MDANEALRLVDQLHYAKFQRHLNDLERQVFIGSWKDQTYSEIYPHKPEYIERTVGYRLWQKLSEASGEKFSKKHVRGAVERLQQRQKQIFISYSDDGHSADGELADLLRQALHQQGYGLYLNNLDVGAVVGGLFSHQSPTEEGQRPTTKALKECHCFVLLLSPRTARREMVLEQLQQLWTWRSDRDRASPLILVLLVDCLPQAVLSHDLQHYLTGAMMGTWQPGSSLHQWVKWLYQYLEGVSHCPLPESSQLDLVMISSPDMAPLAVGMPQATKPMEALAIAAAPPLPAAEPEIPQGQVRLASAFYVERPPCEAQCYGEIGRPGALIRLKAPRQMGKTSLMARILNQAQQLGYRSVALSFQHADRAMFQDLGKLLRWFCSRVAYKLHLSLRLEDHWGDMFGSKDNCTAYFQDYLLAEIDSPLVLCLDEVDAVFQYPTVADDFFGLLRAWYEEASYGSTDSELWEKLRLVVVHSTEVYLPLDVNQSPFNVGLPVELPEFTVDQVTDLARRHGLCWTNQDVINLMSLVGGHPYLVRLGLYHIAQHRITLVDLLETAPTEAGIYGDHLRRHLSYLEQHPDLAQAYGLVLRSPIPTALDSERMFKLHSLGLVHLQGNGAIPSFDLYRQYFRDRLQAVAPEASPPCDLP